MEIIEAWKPIRGFPGYEISNYGRIRSYLRKSPIILKPNSRPNGYLKVDLYRGGTSYTKSIHRLVAETFIPNPTGLPVVNHKDENRFNNRVDNLEWCTHEYNNNYGSHSENISKGVSKKIAQYTPDGRLVKLWDSATVAAKYIGINRQGISRACHTNFKAGGYKWRFVI